ncbi:MAG: RNA methyltransferase [Ignavibacteriales bacterium]|nr:MAG: RNA methyltransferase [Ignavibacteriaceae bacterium]MBW7873647.1 RNA methyltransferase [Ignavibacteria bacterium]MCZ2143877.1 RNA methyltransferase [Ignavibacteriales bacterium]OQY74862.1 MAG: RNA methyltransferase [Ignavibacteriales bacterium UTCHB3]MBV6445852.1 tRNA (guanosine(18)-2'-O)-methyltransferase [Ignavibacteriaceae bacterium]
MARTGSISEARTKRLNFVASNRQNDLTIVIENIHDPHNVSAILRSCDAVGVKTISLIYNIEKFPKLGGKSSASASKWIDVKKYKTVDECFSDLRGAGFVIAASSLNENSRSLYEPDLTQKTAFVIGNEHRGVSEEAIEKADFSYYIPMKGMIQSLNASVAAAVSLYEAFRQKYNAGHYDSPRLPQDEFDELIGRWKKK